VRRANPVTTIDIAGAPHPTRKIIKYASPASIIVLGHKNNRAIDQASLDGADGYATKPFDRLDLTGTIEKIPSDGFGCRKK
jgi:CheY-like chemotaxis protein